MKYYHATNHEILVPDANEHARNLRSVVNGNSVLGLFCNTNPTGLNVFGSRLYSFEIEDGAQVLEIKDEFRQAGRCMEYYRGVRDVLLMQGYQLVTVTHDEGVSAVVLDFDVIIDWRYEGDTP